MWTSASNAHRVQEIAVTGASTLWYGNIGVDVAASPTAASIDAALEPDQKDGFLYFVAIPDADTHAFAKTHAEHQDNLRKYGYL